MLQCVTLRSLTVTVTVAPSAQCQVSGDAWRDVHNVRAFYHMSIAKLRLKFAYPPVYRVPSRPMARAQIDLVLSVCSWAPLAPLHTLMVNKSTLPYLKATSTIVLG
jgi:hypothetical protein